MKKEVQLVLPPAIGLEEIALTQHLRQQWQVPEAVPLELRIKKRSIDARRASIQVHLQLEAFIEETPPPLLSFSNQYLDVRQAAPVIIVGAGPAGMFAALRLIELGLKPILLERGRDVQSRRRDLADLNKKHRVNAHSNYCFGEGGAGTYSDGKLYTRSKKRGDIRRILEILVAHGASEAILYEAHPHIGTNKLPKIVQALRQRILEAGGEIHFDTWVNDLYWEGKRLAGVQSQGGQTWAGKGVLLATGHSARDIFNLLQRHQIRLEFKAFALGVRIEHPQALIDQIQYKCAVRPEYLPASAYSLVSQGRYGGKERGVFSFCMCPGGFIVPAATQSGEIVVNGMSPSRRNSRYANSGTVVSVDWDDVGEFHEAGVLAGLAFQAAIEQKACAWAGGTQRAPAQLLTDFVQGKLSSALNESSYQPGLEAVEMEALLPPFIAQTLKQGIRAFGQKMKGYLSEQGQMIGIESRTSSPVRIPRNPETGQHPEVPGLFPVGEGAGYAGGIMSAAMDGERAAEHLWASLRTSL
ncbi:MAG: FAD-binding protein [Microscillaceae bacterium]|nr:FAD-binding protein [Microscillaceae bacterium]